MITYQSPKEANVTECATCKQKKMRIVVGYWGKNKKYVDENNALWNFKQCPDCNRDRVKNRMRQLRQSRKNLAS